MYYTDLPQNKYTRHYINLIETRKFNKKIKFTTESHHVFPISIFGNNDTTVNLTYKEHYIAHLLLWKMYKCKFGNNHYNTKKCILAIMSFSMINDRYSLEVLNSNKFNLVRKAFRILNAERTKAMWENPEMREHLTNCRKEYWGNEIHREEQSQKRKEWFSNEDNLKRQTEINKEITSRPEWLEQRRLKQIELSSNPEYTKIRIDAMNTPESREKAKANKRKTIDAMSDDERKLKFGRESSEEQRQQHSDSIKGRKYYANLNTLEKRTSKTPIDGFICWDMLTKEQKALFPKKPYDAGIGSRGTMWVFDELKNKPFKIKIGDPIPENCHKGKK